MTWLFAIAIWATVTAGVYLAMSRDVLRIVLGLAILGNGANLIFLGAGRLDRTEPAVVPLGEQLLSATAANPLPQALVLTAIVIGFALLCFSLVLVMRLIYDTRVDDALALRLAEPPPSDPVKPPLPVPGCDPEHPEAVAARTPSAT
jgi:multicomponent Na+:H+ antiporter subunit C